MIYGSVCSGIEAASVAWEPLGWRPAFFSEIEKFPSQVLARHYGSSMPNEPASKNGVPNYGDMTNFKEWPDHAIDLLVGGTPCQDASIGYAAGAGKAGNGLDGERSGLAFTFSVIAKRYRPKWVIWENVPNNLCGRNARGFLRFIESLAESGYACAWRVIDQRDFGVPDQSRPRLYLVGHSDYRCAAAVLLEPEGDCRNSQTRTQAAPVLTARGAMAYDDRTPCILDEFGVRIATPLEWERAFGFPDNYTKINDKTADGPRYKALGNSMAVNCMRWIGQRIQAVESLKSNQYTGAAA